ncbi:DNA-packaging protein FI [Pluralibacter gergoviae]|uniref:DNA-packaging protein FI n=1 Tax=Pluralibacter gergoviae TaxID=61647 RepID=A0AAI9DGK2_PLUGE|nr:DNA-packaging protein FI [Pluralibacter gergoviae]AVR03761.1 DNA-packaging protein FI [Pluralibacter gergoviae]EKV0913229.1 DNA-packaging protein FI [Pluralibacter gergoviae]EKV9907902.1 DNA-packaging protein FI [Pluralibacter gergoviae]EKW6617957.1 DNA-packaging protein FI [Pluralibacter gergoviae]EKW7272463.1 DNA-packaging protein FI [Pluralibacter gergoviae]
MTKEEMIARLKALGEQLDRDVNLTGSKEELAMRVAELEEEIGDEGDGESDAGDDEQDGGETTALATGSVPKGGVQGSMIRIKALFSLHVEALHELRDEPISLVEPGVVVRVSPADARELFTRKLALRL